MRKHTIRKLINFFGFIFEELSDVMTNSFKREKKKSFDENARERKNEANIDTTTDLEYKVIHKL